MLRLAVAAALLAYLFDRVGLRTVWETLAAARTAPVAGAFGATLAAHWLAAVRLGLLTRAQGLPSSTFDLFAINLASVFYGLFLPGGNVAGTAVRVYKMSRENRRYAATLITVLFDRLAATLPLCVLGLSFWIADAPSGAGAALVVLLLGAAGVCILALPLVSSRAWSLAVRVPGARALVGARFGTTAEALAAVRGLSGRTLGAVAALSTGSTLLGIVSYWWIALALGLSTSLVALAWVRSVVMLLSMLPVTIAGLGVREGATVALLRPYGAGDEQALALSLLVFGVTIAAVGVVGGVIEAARAPVLRRAAADETRADSG